MDVSFIGRKNSRMVSDARLEKIKNLTVNRQRSLTVILENVHDPHNLGAVLRTCDSVGIHEIYALYTIESKYKLKAWTGHKSSSGAKKWVQVHYFDNVEKCFKAVRAKYDKIYGTHLSHDAQNFYELNLSESVALLFGNENRGVSDEVLVNLDGNFYIPQVGMTQSLNISVACAVTLYEAKRQRLEKGMYNKNYNSDNHFQKEMFNRYLKISKPSLFKKNPSQKNTSDET